MHRIARALLPLALLLGLQGVLPSGAAAQDDPDGEDTLLMMERATSVDLGRVWHESENGWSGTWRRRGTSNVFDAVWTKDGARVTAVLTMRLQPGGKVSIARRDTSDNMRVDYTGTIDPRGQVRGTGTVRGGGGPFPWSARIEGAVATTTPVVKPPATAPVAPVTPASPSTVSLGRVWHEEENGWNGVWTRRGTSSVFDAVWTKGGSRVEAVLTIRAGGGNAVTVSRRNSSDGVQVDYTGTVDRNGHVTGRGRIVGSDSTFPWKATIDPGGGAPSGPAAASLGRAWHEQENGWNGTWTRRGASSTFDAVWTRDGARVTAVLTMTMRDADSVSIHRRDSSDGMEIDYEGTISRDGRVQGTGRVRSTGWSYPWTATIQP